MQPAPAREVVAADEAPRARTSALVAAALFVAGVLLLMVPEVLVTRTPTLGATPNLPVERTAKLELGPTKLAGALAEPHAPTPRFRSTNARDSR